MAKGDDHYPPLFETKPAKGIVPFRLFSASIFISICFIMVYRVNQMPAKEEAALLGRKWAWIGMLLAELWFSLCWILNVVVKWKPVYRYTYKDRLSQRYDEEVLPGIDIFVCTADAMVEPPSMVINTVLSVMAYDYPPEKLSIYLSDDGCSDLTFYALLEVSRFAEQWLPFCRKFKVEPRSPEAYFQRASDQVEDSAMASEWTSIKKLYEDMKARIETTTKLGRIPEEIGKQHEGFRKWDFVSSRQDHQTIVQILIDGRDSKSVDIEGQPLPTLVYLAREKSPKYHHNFKAGAMNALLRVSSRISNGPIILNVDCDMYSNNSESVRDVLCFFLDEEKGHEIAFVQFAQAFDNLTKNDVYSSSSRLICEVELPGLDSYGGPCYIGSGCFHRRECLCGKKYSKSIYKEEWKHSRLKMEESASVLEELCRVLANCSYEDNTQWGKEMGLKYGCPVEDIITGLAIQCRGWKSIYYNPERKGFLGVAPPMLLQSLVQHKRWSEGDFQILLSKHCPLLYGYKKIPLPLQLSYCQYMLWAPSCLASLYYFVVPSLCLLKGIALFPEMLNPWVIPFVYIFFGNRLYSLGEYLCYGGTFLEWLNDQRMRIFRRSTSYLFAFFDNILKLLRITKSSFIITAKVVDDENVSIRYEQELIEFGATSPMFTILATLALLNAFVFAVGLKRLVMDDHQTFAANPFALQMILCGLLVFINLPVFRGMFFRMDKGRIPTSTTFQSITLALVACSIILY
ncbi:cellulose synthase-like protein E6 isoform X1 [Ziziphus jujuba]|uniref:Cellulose synthase-like protein E6 isoform X1 n=2 Tax=Ziziphus jujuba TaxID=326968 RepID=A0ABM3IT79_ZIZJJ|nr:cellulose synthase-like protein E6 isoform X1 [Ziziphus jujuba]